MVISPVSPGSHINTDRIDRWRALIANLSVIAGIIFLAIEVRQNTESQDESRRLAAANANPHRMQSRS